MKKCLLLAVLGSVLLSLASGCAAPREEHLSVTIKGSDTMVQLGQRWAETYMNAHPDITIQVSAGGSGTGISALIAGTTQICQASRPMTQDEKDKVRSQRGAEVVEIPVALDALAVYLNKENPVQSLTLDQLARIYRGEATVWKDVGGKDGGIVLYGRENSSGTYAYFQEHVLGKKDFGPKYQALPGTGAVIDAVLKDPLGIGYGGIGYARELKTIPVAKDPGAPPVEPTLQNVYNNSYPISRQLFWYTAGAPTGAIKDLIEWVQSSEGQKIVSDVGFYPLRPGQ